MVGGLKAGVVSLALASAAALVGLDDADRISIATYLASLHRDRS